MKYTVVWKPEAERQLAVLWLDSANRVALTEAAHRIDVQLRDWPERTGEWIDDTRKAVVEPPLAAAFRVDREDMLVKVLAVWRVETSGHE